MGGQDQRVTGAQARADAERAGRQRVFASLAGSYLIREAGGGSNPALPLVTRALSADAIVVDCATRPLAGTSVAININGLGLLDGRIAAATASGFTIEPRFADAEALADFGRKLEWLRKVAMRQARNQRGDERHRVPSRRVQWQLEGEGGGDGILYDVSRSGLAIVSSANPPLGTDLTVGSVAARVVRRLPIGFAVQFSTPFDTVADALAQLNGG